MESKGIKVIKIYDKDYLNEFWNHYGLIASEIPLENDFIFTFKINDQLKSWTEGWLLFIEVDSSSLKWVIETPENICLKSLSTSHFLMRKSEIVKQVKEIISMKDGVIKGGI